MHRKNEVFRDSFVTVSWVACCCEKVENLPKVFVNGREDDEVKNVVSK